VSSSLIGYCCSTENQALVDREEMFILLSASHFACLYPHHCDQRSSFICRW